MEFYCTQAKADTPQKQIFQLIFVFEIQHFFFAAYLGVLLPPVDEWNSVTSLIGLFIACTRALMQVQRIHNTGRHLYENSFISPREL